MKEKNSAAYKQENEILDVLSKEKIKTNLKPRFIKINYCNK